ncbi:MAG: helix-turn-helix transcriptional regulator [Mobiluncus sp.]|uniref:helix-turn-helix domain-containing protein n=1 Tax=Mobiluncus sp. TaxID=47293 RepID=UPI00258D43C6|nr:helix-turn-helix transcriptional regulator [Mobiluncus sp.]MCI6584059.1 helix-turn-helix transcriptional regulator [Mobiluncus sp.]
MSSRKKTVDEFGRVVSHVLTLLYQKSGMSYRALASATGMSLNRVGIIFRAEFRSIDVDELFQLCRAFGTRPSIVVAVAECIVYGESPEGLDEADLEAVEGLYRLVLDSKNVETLAHLPTARRTKTPDASTQVIQLGSPHSTDLTALPKMA